MDYAKQDTRESGNLGKKNFKKMGQLIDLEWERFTI